MNITLVKACSDLGTNINGSEKGPIALSNLDFLADKIIIVNKDNVLKELDPNNKTKNIKFVNKFNEKLYNKIINENNFVITLGGDHSISIGSGLASAKKHSNLGILWIDAHADYHTINSTISGNIHGMPLCTITGQNGNELTGFYNGKYINPKKCVIIGARDIEKPEYTNMKNAGVTLFTTEDIKINGTEKIVSDTLDIIKDCDGLHISLDLDIIDPVIAPGVSVKAENGISETELFKILNLLLKQKNMIKSFDLVELNPDLDINNKTQYIATNILELIIKNIKNS